MEREMQSPLDKGARKARKPRKEIPASYFGKTVPHVILSAAKNLVATTIVLIAIGATRPFTEFTLSATNVFRVTNSTDFAQADSFSRGDDLRWGEFAIYLDAMLARAAAGPSLAQFARQAHRVPFPTRTSAPTIHASE